MIGVGNGVGGGHVIAVLTDGTRTLINGHVCHVCGYVRPWPCGHALRGVRENPNVREWFQVQCACVFCVHDHVR